MDSPLAILCAFVNTPAGPDDHEVVREFRGALRDLIDGASGALDRVNATLAWLGHPPRLTAPDRITLALPATGDARGAIAAIAAALVEAAGSGQLKRLGRCAGCGTAFEGAGRGRPARWCDMATCGNRAKVAAFRARRRPAEDMPRSVDELLVRIATRDR